MSVNGRARDHGYNMSSYYEARENSPFPWAFSPHFHPQYFVNWLKEYQGGRRGWGISVWYGGEQRETSRIQRKGTCRFPEMQDRARKGWHSGRTERIISWYSACKGRCQEWLYFLGGHWSRRWRVVTAELVTAGQGICIVLGLLILRVGCTWKITAWKLGTPQKITLGMLSYSCDGRC